MKELIQLDLFSNLILLINNIFNFLSRLNQVDLLHAADEPRYGFQHKRPKDIVKEALALNVSQI